MNKFWFALSELWDRLMAGFFSQPPEIRCMLVIVIIVFVLMGSMVLSTFLCH